MCSSGVVKQNKLYLKGLVFIFYQLQYELHAVKPFLARPLLYYTLFREKISTYF